MCHWGNYWKLIGFRNLAQFVSVTLILKVRIVHDEGII